MQNQQHFYDNQLRRYITQLIRMMSGFSYKDSSGNINVVPVMYGDLTRQVASIIRDNTENKIPNAPRMAVYVTGLELDTDRLRDASYVEKVNVRERAFDEEGNEYLNTEGRNYTVERQMPTPYTITVNVDLWSSNTDQKLQIIEQILMLFNPSLEIQTTDNYLDWTSLSVVNLDSVTWSSRSIPQGAETEIDVATLTFTSPIWIAPPARVKRLGIITDIVSRIHNSRDELIDLTTDIDFTITEGDAETETGIFVNEAGDLERGRRIKRYETDSSAFAIIKTTWKNVDLLVLNGVAQLVKNGSVGSLTWWEFFEAFPARFEQGISTIHLQRADTANEIIGVLEIETSDPAQAVISWDSDTTPTDTVLTSSLGSRTNIDFIIDPQKLNPQELDLSANPRLLLLGAIGDVNNTDGADAWKNLDGTDFVANANDIVEWTGTQWEIVFDSESHAGDTVFVTNLNTGVQYKFENSEWLLAYEGEYPNGTWRIEF